MTIFNIVNVPFRITQIIKFFKWTRRAAISHLCRVTGDFDSYAEMREALTFLYEPPLVPVAGFYVYITGIIAQAIFFVYLEPVLLMYLLGNLALFHFMNRFLVFKMSKMTDLLEMSIFETVVGFSLNIPLIYGISSAFFLKIRGDDHHPTYYIPSILCVVVWVLSVHSPFNIYRKVINWLVSNLFERNKKGPSE